MTDSAKRPHPPVADEEAPKRRGATAADVLAQSAVAVQHSVNALLAALSLCREAGMFDQKPELEVRGDKEVEAAIDRLKGVAQGKRSVFMRKEPAGQDDSPPSAE